MPPLLDGIGVGEQDEAEDFCAEAGGDEGGALNERLKHDERGEDDEPAGDEQQASDQLQWDSFMSVAGRFGVSLPVYRGGNGFAMRIRLRKLYGVSARLAIFAAQFKSQSKL